MVGVISYGLGNIEAFENIYKNSPIKYKEITAVEDFEGVTHLILPGVGAFDYAMKAFNNSGLRAETERLIFEQRLPIVGVCVGMQMLFSQSEEGQQEGLGWIEGRVVRFNIPGQTIPHMGWNQIEKIKDHPILNHIDNGAEFYFLHSYYAAPNDRSVVIAGTDYGVSFPSIVGKDNIYGIQAHPEKSHQNGVNFLINFAGY